MWSPLRARLVSALLLLATLAVVILGSTSVIRRVQSFQPLGLELSEAGERWVVLAVDGAVGLEPEDLILTLNGETPRSEEDLRERLRDRARSEVLVQRADEVLVVPYERPPLAIDFTYLMQVLVGCIYLLIGLYTLVRGLNGQVALFTLWCLSATAVFLLSVTGYRLPIERLLYLTEQMARALWPALTIHFFLTFPQPLLRRRWQRALTPFLYLPGLALFAIEVDMILGTAILGPTTEGRINRLDDLFYGLLALFGIGAILVLFLQLHRSTQHRAAQREEARQMLWVTLGMGGGTAPFIIFYALPRLLGLGEEPLLSVAAVLPLGLVPLSVAYAILRYRLWDIAVIVRDVATYTLTILLGVVGFSVLDLLIDRVVEESSTLPRYVMTFVAGLVVAGLMIPTKQGIASTLQRFHYRTSFGRRRALSKFAHELLHERDLEQLSTGLLRELDDAMGLELSNLYVVEERVLVPVHEDGSPDDLPADFLGDDIWDRDHVVLPGVALPVLEPTSHQALFLLGYRYAFPLTVRERRIGLVFTGNKLDQVPLSSDDTMLIRQLLNQAALAIENAQLLEQLQKQLREVSELKQFNEEIIESSPAGIAVLDAEERVVSANLAFAALVGLERSAVRRRSLRDLLPLDSVPRPDAGLVAINFVDRQSRDRHLQVSSASFLGNSAGMRVLVVHDVTERVAMEQALEEKDRLAALGVVAAGVAHEVNTPLTGISSYAQMLLAETPEDDARHKILKKVEKQTFRAASIVNNLLQFARRGEHNPIPLDLLKVVDSACELLSDRFIEKGLHLEVDVPREPVIVAGNDGELGQVLTNLLLNAIDATPKGGAVTIALVITETEAQLSVHDTGRGVPDEHLEQVFRPFFSTKTNRGGTGLGLSISQEIARRHHGELVVNNRPEGGACFSLTLPLGGKQTQ